MNTIDVIVIGAGAAGLMAAGTAANGGLSTVIIERNQRPARKLMITGKGRCNITNDCTPEELIASVPGGGRFLYGAAHHFTAQDTMTFFERQGLKLKTERGKRVFPLSDKAVDAVDALVSFARKNARIVQGRVISLIIRNGAVQGVLTEDGKEYYAPRVLVATGGLSYPGTGSTGDGYALAQQAGHTIVPPRASLVPLVAQKEDRQNCKEAQGLSLKNIAVSVVDTQNNKVIFKDFGELLFTHFGLSGPVILSASAHMQNMAPAKYTVCIDLKPALDTAKLDARVLRDFNENSNRNISNVLEGLLPRKLIPVMIKLSKLSPGTKVNQMTRQMRASLVALLKKMPVVIEGFRPIEEAVITAGGVATREISPKTMESKLVPGLYFAGEVLDVDAYTGGFNLQIAFATGRLAATAMIQAQGKVRK